MPFRTVSNWGKAACWKISSCVESGPNTWTRELSSNWKRKRKRRERRERCANLGKAEFAFGTFDHSIGHCTLRCSCNDVRFVQNLNIVGVLSCNFLVWKRSKTQKHLCKGSEEVERMREKGRENRKIRRHFYGLFHRFEIQLANLWNTARSGGWKSSRGRRGRSGVVGFRQSSAEREKKKGKEELSNSEKAKGKKLTSLRSAFQGLLHAEGWKEIWTTRGKNQTNKEKKRKKERKKKKQTHRRRPLSCAFGWCLLSSIAWGRGCCVWGKRLCGGLVLLAKEKQSRKKKVARTEIWILFVFFFPPKLPKPKTLQNAIRSLHVFPVFNERFVETLYFELVERISLKLSFEQDVDAHFQGNQQLNVVGNVHCEDNHHRRTGNDPLPLLWVTVSKNRGVASLKPAFFGFSLLCVSCCCIALKSFLLEIEALFDIKRNQKSKKRTSFFLLFHCLFVSKNASMHTFK